MISIPHALPAVAAALGLWLALAGPCAAAEPAGEVKYLRGKATATLEDRVRELDKGEPVYGGETIATRRGALLVMVFRDGTDFTLTNRAEMTIDRFEYGEDAEEPSIATRVLRGTFRFVSGLIAKREPRAMRVDAGAVATIGIRGTHVAGEVEGDSAVVVLMEPEGEAANAISVANEHGSVEIDEAGYGTEIPDANSPPSPPRRMRLRSIDNLMRSLQSVRRGTVPRPRPSLH